MKKIMEAKIYLSLLLFCFSFCGINNSANAEHEFSEGTVSFNLGISTGRAFNHDYSVFSLGVGYFPFEGLELGINIQQWNSDAPDITKISPQMKYVFTDFKTLTPYVGGFYRLIVIEDQNDQSSYGLRTGIFFSGNGNVVMGVGVVYEEYIDCEPYNECSTVTPEFLVSINY